MKARSFFCHPERSEGPHINAWRVRSTFVAVEYKRKILRRPLAAQDDSMVECKKDYVTGSFD